MNGFKASLDVENSFNIYIPKTHEQLNSIIAIKLQTHNSFVYKTIYVCSLNGKKEKFYFKLILITILNASK